MRRRVHLEMSVCVCLPPKTTKKILFAYMYAYKMCASLKIACAGKHAKNYSSFARKRAQQRNYLYTRISMARHIFVYLACESWRFFFRALAILRPLRVAATAQAQSILSFECATPRHCWCVWGAVAVSLLPHRKTAFIYLYTYIIFYLYIVYVSA